MNSISRINPQDTVILFVDLQEGIIEHSRTTPLDRLTKCVGALSKLAKLLDIPVVISGIEQNGKPAKVIPQIAESLGNLPVHHRTTADSFLNEEIVSAIKQTGRKTLLIAGVLTEIAVQLPSLTASDQDYKVYAVLDACGGASERTEQAALARMAKAGASTVSVITLALELAGDFREPKAQQAVGILYGLLRA
jgi:nicotinamidase-related amidase